MRFLSLTVFLLAFCQIWASNDQATVDEAVEGTTEQPIEEPTEPEPIYQTPLPVGNFYLAEHFDDREEFQRRWIPSEAKKEGTEEKIAKYNGKWDLEVADNSPFSGDLSLALKTKARHHAISTRLDKPFVFDGKPFILQYEARFQNGQECGGAYMKLLSNTPDLDLKGFNDRTPFTIMFGPDKCGNDHKVHWIFRHRNPNNGTYAERHWKKAGFVPKIEEVFKDKKPHLFTLVISPDNTFEVLLNRKSVHKGSLLEDFNPPVNPPAEIDDPTDFKPADWDDKEKIPDPLSKKPDEWDENAPRQIPDVKALKPPGWLDDEPELIPDPSAEKPADWDDEMDGIWEAPLISNPVCENVGCGEWKPPMVDNPRYKGRWKAPLIDNPNFKGKWKPRRIQNPDFFEDKNPYKMTAIGALGFELWSMSEGILFDNIIITDDMNVAAQWAAETWALKKEMSDRETDNLLISLVKYTNKYPWLWAVYIIAVGLPVVLFISFCCITPTTKDKEGTDAAEAKKTDAPTPDDPKPSTSSQPAKLQEQASLKVSPSVPSVSKAAPPSPRKPGIQIKELPPGSTKELLKKNEEEQDEVSDSDENDVEVVDEADVQEDGFQEEEQEIEDTKKTSPAARRRRPRRD